MSNAGWMIAMMCAMAAPARAEEVAPAPAATPRADFVVAAGGFAGFAPRSAVGGGMFEIGVPVGGHWLVHAMGVVGGSEELSFLGESHTSGQFSQLRAGFAVRFSRVPGRYVELGMDGGRQHIEWRGTDVGFLGGDPSSVSYRRVDGIVVPRMVGAFGTPGSSAELRFGVEGAFDLAGAFAGFDATLGVGCRF